MSALTHGRRPSFKEQAAPSPRPEAAESLEEYQRLMAEELERRERDELRYQEEAPKSFWNRLLRAIAIGR